MDLREFFGPTVGVEKCEEDLGLNVPFVKGRQIPVRNCWHFFTNGNDVDVLFEDRADFVAGMNRAFVHVERFRILVLAFTLMDTHVHFILYGNLEMCKLFMHEYMRNTSRYISIKYKERNKLKNVTISHQPIDNDHYLKIVICYLLKNPPVAGLTYSAYSYPWGSHPLYFQASDEWVKSCWSVYPETLPYLSSLSRNKKRQFLRTRDTNLRDVRIIDDMVYPGDYVAWELVERIFKSHKAFNAFMSIAKEEYVESQGGFNSNITIPFSELRQHRNEIIEKWFGECTIRQLTIDQRLKVAKHLRNNYNCSFYQVCRICGLSIEQMKRGII